MKTEKREIVCLDAQRARPVGVVDQGHAGCGLRCVEPVTSLFGCGHAVQDGPQIKGWDAWPIRGTSGTSIHPGREIAPVLTDVYRPWSTLASSESGGTSAVHSSRQSMTEEWLGSQQVPAGVCLCARQVHDKSEPPNRILRSVLQSLEIAWQNLPPGVNH